MSAATSLRSRALRSAVERSMASQMDAYGSGGRGGRRVKLGNGTWVWIFEGSDEVDDEKMQLKRQRVLSMWNAGDEDEEDHHEEGKLEQNNTTTEKVGMRSPRKMLEEMITCFMFFNSLLFLKIRQVVMVLFSFRWKNNG